MSYYYIPVLDRKFDLDDPKEASIAKRALFFEYLKREIKKRGYLLGGDYELKTNVKDQNFTWAISPQTYEMPLFIDGLPRDAQIADIRPPVFENLKDCGILYKDCIDSEEADEHLVEMLKGLFTNLFGKTTLKEREDEVENYFLPFVLPCVDHLIPAIEASKEIISGGRENYVKWYKEVYLKR